MASNPSFRLQFRQEIWDELVKRQQLSRDSDGFYRVGVLKGGT